MKKHAPAEEAGRGEKAPIWIISFADMVSLLMAFFVMLQTLAATKSGKFGYTGEGVFEATLEGFRKTIAGYGMPSVFGGASNQMLNFDSERTYYPFSGDSDTVGSIKDAREEKIRRTFNRISGYARTLNSQIRGRAPNFIVTPIAFEQGQAEPGESAKRFLDKFAADLPQTTQGKSPTIYVVGLAWREKNEKEQWTLSAKRAESVADYLRNKLSAAGGRHVYSWGAGAGGDWIKGENAVSEQSQILIAVLSGED